MAYLLDHAQSTHSEWERQVKHCRWTCYHCGETFHSSFQAAQHFGAPPDGQPGCLLRVQRGERGLLIALREAEAELVRYREEDTDLHRQIARVACENGGALRREEEQGYARGLRDERARALRIIARVKAGLGLRDGARNACDDVARDLQDGRDG